MVDYEALAKRLNELSLAVSENRMTAFSMSIPADPKRDADIVLRDAADELLKLKARYTWAANELLACDYGDNDNPAGVVGWHVYGWRYRQDRIDRRIYGGSIDIAIDAELAKGKRSEGGTRT